MTSRRSHGVLQPQTSAQRRCRSDHPDHVIAHLSAGGKLDMQIKVEQGRGYVVCDSRQIPHEHVRSVIRVGRMFSPVSRVSYAVEARRVEQRTASTSLVMHIETNRRGRS